MTMFFRKTRKSPKNLIFQPKKQLDFGHGLVSVYVSSFQDSKHYTPYPGLCSDGSVKVYFRPQSIVHCPLKRLIRVVLAPQLAETPSING
jgi:hypothetical protein